MQSILFHDFNDATVEEVERPSPTGDEVLVAVSRVQLSVTECNLYRGEKIAHYDQISRRLEDPPVRMLGHEFCGEVVETGPDVTSLSVGDRVYAPGKIPCEECPHCRSGQRNYCPDKIQIGYDIPGGLSEYVALPEGPLWTLPDSVTDTEGAAMQPFTSSVGSVASTGVDSGDVVAVVGTGVMGYQCAQVAQHEGAKEVFAIDIEQEKLDIAADRELRTIDASVTDPVSEIKDETDGVGADFVFEAAGGPQDHGTEGMDPLAQAMGIARRGGSVVQVGHIIGDITLTPRAIKSRNVDWITPPPGVFHLGPNTDVAELSVELVAENEVSIDDYVTHELDGLESFEELVEITLNKPEHGALGPAQIVV